MKIPKLENLEITQLTNEVFFIHQIKATNFFTRSDGLLVLPSPSKNQTPVIIDLNLQPKEISLVYNAFHLSNYNRIDYVISHAHMDHIANVYKWEELGVTIHCPQEHQDKITNDYLNELKELLKGSGYREEADLLVDGLNKKYVRTVTKGTSARTFIDN